LVHSRMRTGSTLTGSYFANHPDFFYIYEPGLMIAWYKRLNVLRDSFDYLEAIRPTLVDFMHAFYHCDFTGRKYFYTSINNSLFLRRFSNITHLEVPMQEKTITQICKSKRHIVSKTIRLNNILLAAPVLKADEIKVIHLVRDPRGMAYSRRQFEHLPTGVNNKTFKLPEKLEEVVKDDCT
ncbi:carbohydrate sulfotransferase 5-like, partial [Saccoglossus kowalevskii]